MIWWDAGSYHFEGPHTLVLSTATDEMVQYEVHVRDDQLDFVDPEGCRFTYRREQPTR